MHTLKPFSFTLKVLLFLLSLLTLKPLVDANTRNLISFNIQQVTINTNNDSFAYEFDDEDIINRTPLTIESDIIAEEFRYLMKFGVKTYGNHDVDTYAIPDTGSDLIWLQDRICNDGKDDKNCYEAKVNEYREKPKDPIDCWVDDRCNKTLPALGIKHRCTKKHKCEYSGIVYGDGSKNEGILGQADFFFSAITSKSKPDRRVERKMTIGFSPKLGGDEGESKSLYQGIVGLGYGNLSLIKQYAKTRRRCCAFSYYLPQFRRKDEDAIKARSKFKFGDDVKISDKNTSLLLPKNKDDECGIRYCVQLEGVFLKFEDENHEIKTDTDHKVMIIDSGTTKTYLRLTCKKFEEFINKIKEKLNVELTKFEGYYENCFEKNDENKKKLEKLEKISFKFSGTKIELKRENFLDDDFTPPPIKSNGDQKKYICLTVERETKREYHILGSRAQMDFLVAFNVTEGNKIVSFDHLEVEDNKHIEESLVLSE
ncbi:probable aspartic protease At2g35615 [Trifolium pratense]|uniref:probable aspartic protease At2g35615 n=1 Tax=Trifolium pratense TaxID=57577 RepID=UPI001E69389C|nr:probable aspartic protease At2g35615 [Trifolium pratense]